MQTVSSVLSEHGVNFERFRLNKASGQNLSRSTLVFVLLYLTRVMLPSKTQISIQCNYAELREKDFVIRQGRYSKLDSETEEKFPTPPCIQTKLWSWKLSKWHKKLRSELFSELGSKKDFNIQIALPSYVEISWILSSESFLPGIWELVNSTQRVGP